MVLPKGYPVKRLIFFILLSTLDIFTTYILLKYGWGKEANPVAAKIISWGWSYTIFIKYFTIALLCLILYRALKKKKTRAVNLAINFLIIFYIAVVANNLLIIVIHL